MALDSLLASLKTGVTEVTRVQPCSGGAFGCNPTKPDGVTEVTPPAIRPDSVTPVTPCNSTGLQPEPLQTGACTLVTPVTPQNSECGGATTDQERAAVLRWLAHIGEADQSTIAEVLTRCEQDAGARAYFVGRAAEAPALPTCEAYEERAAIMEFDAGLSRAEAEQAAALDVGCIACAHFARPGLSDGYCGGRGDLPRAYGDNHPLRHLPSDKGATCKEWRAQQ